MPVTRATSIPARQSLPGRGRRGSSLVLALTLALTLAGIGALRADAASLSTSQVQWNLAALAYLSYSDVDGQTGPTTQGATTRFQVDRCMDADGAAGSLTGDQLVAVVKAVQSKVGATQDGLAGPTTKDKIIAWQRSHGLTADGLAGPSTFSAMGLSRTRSCGSRVNTPVLSSSSSVACASGTTDLGVNTGYYDGHSVSLRLCAIPGFRSSSEESSSGSSYYVSGAAGNVIVNSRASGALLGIFLAAKNSGLTLSAVSSFRTMRHQQDLCNANALCRGGTYTYVAKPGYSSHQLGVAVDFSGPTNKGGATCASRATSTTQTWKYLVRNAARFGIEQYSAESWHWDARTDLSNRC